MNDELRKVQIKVNDSWSGPMTFSSLKKGDTFRIVDDASDPHEYLASTDAFLDKDIYNVDAKRINKNN